MARPTWLRWPLAWRSTLEAEREIHFATEKAQREMYDEVRAERDIAVRQRAEIIDRLLAWLDSWGCTTLPIPAALDDISAAYRCCIHERDTAIAEVKRLRAGVPALDLLEGAHDDDPAR